MKRRQFIKNSSLCISGIAFGKIALGNLSKNSPVPVFVSGGNPADMYDKGIVELGGIKKFISKGNRVVIKPNILTNSTPDEHHTTNPELLKRIIEQCYEAGAKIVSVFEHTNDSWTKCYKNTGIERVAKDARARVLPANEEFYYSEVKNPDATVLQSIKLHQSLVDSDVFINLSVFKPDTETSISGAIKNLMGCIWDKNWLATNGIETCLAEFLSYKKPDLNITEIYSEKRTCEIILSEDIVAADSYASFVKDIQINFMNHVAVAEKMGFGHQYHSESAIKKLQM